MNPISSIIDSGHQAPAQMLELLRAVGPVEPVARSAAISGEAERQAGQQAEPARPVAAEPIEVADLDEAVEEINLFLLGVPTHLEFRVEQDLDQLIVSVVDSESGDVLRQLPPDEVLRIAQRVREADFGLLDSVA